MANVPAELKYTKEHEWAKREGDRIRIGITEYAQEQLGDVVFVRLPNRGDRFDAHQAFGEIEAVKAVVKSGKTPDRSNVRDALLAVSGRLNPKAYGPSVPIYLTPFLDGRGRPGSGPLDGDGRRSLYLAVRRNFLSPLLLAFDTPIPFSTVGRRSVSNPDGGDCPSGPNGRVRSAGGVCPLRRSPGSSPETAEPNEATVPAISWPSVRGGETIRVASILCPSPRSK